MVFTNNIRNIKKDMNFRKTVAIRLGRKKAIQALTILLVIDYMFLLFLIISSSIPVTAIIAWIAFPIAVKLRWSLRKDAPRTDELSSMGWASKHHWAIGITFCNRYLDWEYLDIYLITPKLPNTKKEVVVHSPCYFFLVRVLRKRFIGYNFFSRNMVFWF